MDSGSVSEFAPVPEFAPVLEFAPAPELAAVLVFALAAPEFALAAALVFAAAPELAAALEFAPAPEFAQAPEFAAVPEFSPAPEVALVPSQVRSIWEPPAPLLEELAKVVTPGVQQAPKRPVASPSSLFAESRPSRRRPSPQSSVELGAQRVSRSRFRNRNRTTGRYWSLGENRASSDSRAPTGNCEYPLRLFLKLLGLRTRNLRNRLPNHQGNPPIHEGNFTNVDAGSRPPIRR
jgi:hypothetical protein